MVMATMDQAAVDRIFQALADATRRDILEVAMAGELGVSSIAERYDMSFAAVQKHVAVLERAGLVTKQPRGRERLVCTDMDALRRARDLLDQYEDLWRGRIDRMAAILEDDEDHER